MTKSTSYRRDIDGLRAVAVLAVMVFHLRGQWLPGGFVGVDVFFVISGFVVTGSLAASRAPSVAAFIGEFYGRRLMRIVPALVLVLLVSAVLATLFIPPAWLSGLSDETARKAFFGLSNWVMQRNTDTYFAPRTEYNPYVHTWSLGVEEQYYVVAPFLVYFLVRAQREGDRRRVRLSMAGLGLVTAGSIAGCIWATRAHPTDAFYFIGFRFWELATGALLFLATDRDDIGSKTTALQRAGMAWVGAACVVAGLGLADAEAFPWPWAVLPTVGTALLIGGARERPRDLVRLALAQPWAVWVGRRSYSLYLWHWPVYVLMRWTVGLENMPMFAVAVLSTVILAMLSYRFVEQPWRHHAWFERRPVFVRITVFALLPLVGYAMVVVLFSHRVRGLVSLSSVVQQSADWYAGERMDYPEFGDRQCQVDMETARIGGGNERRFVPRQCRTTPWPHRLWVLGDSHAGMISPSLELLSAELAVPVSQFSFAGCGYLGLDQPMDVSATPGCHAFNRAVTERVLTASQRGDIVLLSSLRLHRYGDVWINFDVPDMYALMYRGAAADLRRAAAEDAQRWLQPFAEKGVTVVFSAPLPLFKAPPFRCSDWFNAFNPICIGQGQQRRDELQALRKPVMDGILLLASRYPNIRLWDAFPVLCPEPVCRTHRDGRPLYFDGDHLSAYGNRIAYPSLKQMLLDAASARTL